MNPKPLIIAIDGPSGAGKSTVARLLASRLGLTYIDTGAMYRAVGLLAARAGIELPLDDKDAAAVAELAATHRIELSGTGMDLHVLLDGEDVSEVIRTPECALMASAVSAVSAVRRALVAIQRRIGLESGGVMEGRDIGSVVFPDAVLKVFLTASPAERARRRQADLHAKGIEATVDDVRREQHQRDLQDSTRSDSPLHVARGSIVVDTSESSLDEVVARLLAELAQRMENRLDTIGGNTIRSRNHGGLVRREPAPIEEESS
ncbi:MAG: (d)CMP kinase [Thermoanaerobaculales bacterium]|nr:(d)CMP kinase [Thermoanaerobaculales bacterium]